MSWDGGKDLPYFRLD